MNKFWDFQSEHPNKVGWYPVAVLRDGHRAFFATADYWCGDEWAHFGLENCPVQGFGDRCPLEIVAKNLANKHRDELVL